MISISQLSSSLPIVRVRLLFCLTTWVDLFLMYSIDSLLRLSRFSVLFFWLAAIIGKGFKAVGLLVIDILLLKLESELLELFELINTLIGLYLLLEASRLILFISLDALTTQILLAFTNFWYYTLMRLCLLTRQVRCL